MHRLLLVASVIGLLSRIALAQTPQSSCDALLQHSLAWWLSPEPTTADRNQLAACMSGAVTTIVSPAPAAGASPSPAIPHPSNWNLLLADEQAMWSRLAPKAWRDMTEFEQKEWYRVLSKRSPSAESASGGHPTAQAPTSIGGWTAATCDAERVSLGLLSHSIDQSEAQLQDLASAPPPSVARKKAQPQPPPTYRCTKDGRETTCQPDNTPKYGSPGAAATQALDDSLADSQAEARFSSLAARVKALEQSFSARHAAWSSHCAK